MTTIICYLWAISNNLSCCFLWLGAISLIASIAYLACNLVERYEGSPEEESIKKLQVIFAPGARIITAIIFFILSAMTPPKDDIAMVYIAPKIIDSKVIQKDFPEIFELGTKILKNRLEQVSGNKVTENVEKKVDELLGNQSKPEKPKQETTAKIPPVIENKINSEVKK